MTFDIKNLKEHDSELLRLLTHNLPDMLWVKDLEGTYLYANQAICDGLLMAKDTQEPLGKHDLFFAKRERDAHSDIPDWHTFGELCFNSDLLVIENNKAMKFEEYGNVRGKLLYLEVYKAPFYDRNGKILGTVGAGRDITELKKIQHDLQESLSTLNDQKVQLASFNSELEKRVEQEVQKQEKQERIMIHQSRQAAMGELLESIAHQWRQPLNIIGLAVANLETQETLGITDKKNFSQKMDIINSNINYMSDTIDSFRNFLNPKIQNIVFHPSKLIEDVLQILKEQLLSNNVNVSLEINQGFTLCAVENEFKQVLMILLNNSIDAIRSEQEKKNIQEGKIIISCMRNENEGIVEISDNGGGIDADIIYNIFEPYFTTKGDSFGTGVGLYTTKNIVESRMKGTISVKNIDGGTCFSIRVPVVEKN